MPNKIIEQDEVTDWVVNAEKDDRYRQISAESSADSGEPEWELEPDILTRQITEQYWPTWEEQRQDPKSKQLPIVGDVDMMVPEVPSMWPVFCTPLEFGFAPTGYSQFPENGALSSEHVASHNRRSANSSQRFQTGESLIDVAARQLAQNVQKDQQQPQLQKGARMGKRGASGTAAKQYTPTFCAYCGGAFQPGSKFCMFCGKPVTFSR
jgi:hypothetical protein